MRSVFLLLILVGAATARTNCAHGLQNAQGNCVCYAGYTGVLCDTPFPPREPLIQSCTQGSCFPASGALYIRHVTTRAYLTATADGSLTLTSTRTAWTWADGMLKTTACEVDIPAALKYRTQGGPYDINHVRPCGVAGDVCPYTGTGTPFYPEWEVTAY